MIKIETSYKDATDEFCCEYEQQKSHTLEHIALIAKLWLTINENDEHINDMQILIEVNNIKNQLKMREGK